MLVWSRKIYCKMICIVINECLSRGMTNRSPAECQGASEEGNDFARMLKNVNNVNNGGG